MRIEPDVGEVVRVLDDLIKAVPLWIKDSDEGERMTSEGSVHVSHLRKDGSTSSRYPDNVVRRLAQGNPFGRIECGDPR